MFGFIIGGPLMSSCALLANEAAKPVWVAKQLTRLPCLVVYVKFQFVYVARGACLNY